MPSIGAAFQPRLLRWCALDCWGGFDLLWWNVGLRNDALGRSVAKACMAFDFSMNCDLVSINHYFIWISELLTLKNILNTNDFYIYIYSLIMINCLQKFILRMKNDFEVDL